MTDRQPLERLRVGLRVIALWTMTCLLVGAPIARGQDTPCAFDSVTFAFVGSPVEQARCLMRPIKKFGHIGPLPAQLPAPLEQLVGQPTSFGPAVLRHYLSAKGIQESEIGGSLTDPLSPADTQNLGAGSARYFVIHDTSTPNFLNQPFPSDIDLGTWTFNTLSRYSSGSIARRAHIYVNRSGQSVTTRDFKLALPTGNFGTKFARNRLGERRKGLMLHIEMIQPRRRDPAGGASNDALAPTPGFPDAQLDRLALLYVAASVRSGRWLIPALHAAMDVTIRDAHDDPQNFDVALWAARLDGLIRDITTARGPTPAGTGFAAVRSDNFDIPEPTVRGRKLVLWATYYYVFGDVQSVQGGHPLLDTNGGQLGPLLSTSDWCLGAVEGTIRVVDPSGAPTLYNFAARGRQVQVDCSSILRNPSLNLKAIGSSRFIRARGPFGDGVRGMILVPFRTIAVDRNVIPYGTAIFIPATRGQQVTLPSGQTVLHDGYFFAADTGGAIKREHVDVFSGLQRSNPFPGVVKSKPTETFDAFIVDDPQIVARLRQLHTP